jgi:large subunit ribosomal protein L21
MKARLLDPGTKGALDTMQAVITSGGKQYLVEKDQVLEVELLGDEKKVTFDVLMVIDGDSIKVGAPLVEGAKVHAEVVEEVKGDKIKILKFKPKKRVKRLTGHRQHYAQVKITKIG